MNDNVVLMLFFLICKKKKKIKRYTVKFDYDKPKLAKKAEGIRRCSLLFNM